MTEYVVTRWYRCPELLLSPNRPYSEAIDLWSIGCILAELIKRKPLFPGKSHAHQVQLVFEVMGYNTPADLGFPVNGEAVSFLDKRCRYRKQPLKNFIPEASPQAMELLEALLTVNPDLRPSAATALQHPFLADAEILNDYSRPYLRRPTADYFDFEHEKYTVGELKAMIEEDVHSLAANAYRLGAGGNTRSAAVASSNAMDRSSAQHTSSYDLQSGRDESDGPVSQLATQVKNTRLTSGPTNANSSHAHHSIAGSNMETAKTTKETNNNPFRPSYSTSTSTTTGRQSAEVAAINNGNILTAVRNDMIGGSNPAVANAMRSARKSTPKTPSPRKIDIILQKDQANKAKAMKEKEEEMVNTARSDTSSGIADGVAGGNLYANIFARRSGSSGTTASASNKATGDSTSKRFGRLMSAFPSLPGGGKSGNLHAANAITNSGRVYRGSNLDADRSSNPAQAKASIAMMHSGSNILHHDF